MADIQLRSRLKKYVVLGACACAFACAGFIGGWFIGRGKGIDSPLSRNPPPNSKGEERSDTKVPSRGNKPIPIIIWNFGEIVREQEVQRLLEAHKQMRLLSSRVSTDGKLSDVSVMSCNRIEIQTEMAIPEWLYKEGLSVRILQLGIRLPDGVVTAVNLIDLPD